MFKRILTFTAAAMAMVSPAHAQRAEENIVRAADDAFGVQLGNDKIGIYNDRDVRGFSPIAASNVRLEGMYFDMRGNIPTRILASTQIKVGITAQGYPFPAPTGIVDYQLKTADKRVISVLAQAGPNEGYSYELDTHTPLIGKKLTLFAGAVTRREEPMPGLSVHPISVGGVLRYRPVTGTEMMAFIGHYDRFNGKLTPNVFTSGPFLPADIEAKRFSQDWVESDLTGETYGVTAKTNFARNWLFDIGVFRYYQLNSGNVIETYLNTDANAVAASHRFTADPENKQDSYSGEARVTGVFTGDKLRHTLHFSVRAREAMRTFGGSTRVTVATPVQIGLEAPIAKPAFAFSALSRDEVGQSSVGASYSVALRGVGEFGFAAQKVNYEKVVDIATPASRVVTKDSPLLHNLSLALTPNDKLTLYASFARGLEDANTAPAEAVNIGEAPPAIRTVQYDAGFRYALTPSVKLIAGWFRIEKPYFNLDPSNVYRELGLESHKGYEISLAGQVGERLNIIAGAVLMKPEVTGEAVTTGQIGEKPVGQAERIFKFNADYRLASVKGLSFDMGINYSGPRAATGRTFVALGGKQLMTEEFATLDLGARYRFKIFDGKPATLRVQALNVTDEFAWQVAPSGALQSSNPHAFQASLAVDF